MSSRLERKETVSAYRSDRLDLRKLQHLLSSEYL